MSASDDFWAEGSYEFSMLGEPPLFTLAVPVRSRGASVVDASGKIEIFSSRVAGCGYDDCPPHARLDSHSPPARSAAVSRWAEARRSGPLTLRPDDAASRGIAEGDTVTCFNERGASLAAATLLSYLLQERP